MEILSLTLSIIATILWIITILLSKNASTRYHESSRREKAAELLLYWSKNLNKKSSLARKYVEEFNEEQTENLLKQEEITFDEKNEKLYIGIKELLNKNNIDENRKLTSAECTELRWLVITYLNMLESILIAWRHNIADTDVIEEQFAYLVGSNKEQQILEKFRKITGGRSTYPSIEIFCSYLNNKNKQPINRKDKL